MSASNEKFREILGRHNIPIDLKSQTIAMHRQGVGGNKTVTIYGVGYPIPQEIREEIEKELIPLINNDAAPGCRFEVLISDRVLPMESPAKSQANWNTHCALASLWDG